MISIQENGPMKMMSKILIRSKTVLPSFRIPKLMSDLMKKITKRPRHKRDAFLWHIFNGMGEQDHFPHLAAFGKLYDIRNDHPVCDYLEIMSLWYEQNKPRRNRAGGRRRNLGCKLFR